MMTRPTYLNMVPDTVLDEALAEMVKQLKRGSQVDNLCNTEKFRVICKPGMQVSNCPLYF
jgi:hypothetical protein